MKLVLDAMGGDNAPIEEIKGAYCAIKELSDTTVVLVGKKSLLEEKILELGYKPNKQIEIVNAEETIGMGESPATAVRQKKDASINVAMKIVKSGEAGGVVSCGNTGAVMTAALFGLGRIKGIDRPAIAGVFPTSNGDRVLLDIGANVDCKVKHLIQFADMGTVFAKKVMNIKNPRVALFNIGEEEEKGSELTTAAYQAFKNDKNINFVGNVEGNHFFNAEADVIVADGFVGNTMLKVAEGVAYFIFTMLKQKIRANFMTKLAGIVLYPGLKFVKKQLEADEHGGAPLLGVKGVCIIGHGNANDEAIKNALRVAHDAVSKNLVQEIANID